MIAHAVVDTTNDEQMQTDKCQLTAFGICPLNYITILVPKKCVLNYGNSFNSYNVCSLFIVSNHLQHYIIMELYICTKTITVNYCKV